MWEERNNAEYIEIADLKYVLFGKLNAAFSVRLKQVFCGV